LLVGVSVAGWRQWSAWNTIVLPEPVKANWEVRPGPSVFHTDGGGRPATLSEMLRNVDAVVVARMNRDQIDEVKVGRTPDNLAYRTGFRFTVVEVITGELTEGDPITIWRLGKREDTEEFFLRPKLGETFVCFLTRSRFASGYEPVYGRYGTYQVSGGLLHQLVPHPTTAKYEGKPVDMFLSDLRALSKGKR
jgi:hypothetical protein